MGLLTGVSSFFGLDIGTTAVRAVQLRGGGPVKTLLRYAYVPIDSKLALSDSKTDQQRLAQVIKELVTQAGMSTRNVAVGIPSGRVFTAVVDFDRLPQDELAKAIRYQADSLIPTPLDKSKMDWAVIGDSPKDKTKVEVLLSSVENDFVEQRLDMLESIGLDVIAFEPDNLALTRALIAGDSPQAQMVFDMGSRSADLVVTFGGAPRLTRSIPTGADSIVRAAAQNLNIDDKQARQFVFKFGMSKDKLEGRIYSAISSSVEVLTGEIDKSIKFFQSRYPESPIGRIVVTGGASALPEFPLYIANKFGVEVEIGNAWRNVSFAPDRQNELLAVSNHFGVATGLAERVE
jgi:type IV pilus assembly protein PilM